MNEFYSQLDNNMLFAILTTAVTILFFTVILLLILYYYQNKLIKSYKVYKEKYDESMWISRIFDEETESVLQFEDLEAEFDAHSHRILSVNSEEVKDRLKKAMAHKLADTWNPKVEEVDNPAPRLQTYRAKLTFIIK